MKRNVENFLGVFMEAMFFLLSIGLAILVGNCYGVAYGFASFFLLFALIVGMTSNTDRHDGR
jgi:hypothetical protein